MYTCVVCRAFVCSRDIILYSLPSTSPYHPLPSHPHSSPSFLPSHSPSLLPITSAHPHSLPSLPLTLFAPPPSLSPLLPLTYHSISPSLLHDSLSPSLPLPPQSPTTPQKEAPLPVGPPPSPQSSHSTQTDPHLTSPRLTGIVLKDHVDIEPVPGGVKADRELVIEPVEVVEIPGEVDAGGPLRKVLGGQDQKFE